MPKYIAAINDFYFLKSRNLSCVIPDQATQHAYRRVLAQKGR